MVNPSKADAEIDDHTIRKWYGFSDRLGIGRFIVGNLFAYRATNVDELKTAVDPVGPENDKHIEQIMKESDMCIVGWGQRGKLPGNLRDRWAVIYNMASWFGRRPLYCLGIAKDGHPLHPLMLSYESELLPWRPDLFLKEKLAIQPESTRDWYRAAGDCLCPKCGFEYRSHPVDSTDEFLHVLCNGDRVKL